MENIVRRLLLPTAALFQVLGSSLPQVFDWGVTIGERSRALDTAIVPAGWAFSIWGLIFLWSIAFAAYAASRSDHNAALANKVAWPAAGAFTANGIWGLYTPLFGLNIGSEVIIIIGLVCAISAALIAGRHASKTTSERLLIAAPLGLLAGWLTAASFVGGSSILRGLGVDVNMMMLIAILAGATLFASFVISRGPSPAYSAALIWALSAIIAKNLNGGNDAIVYSALLAAAALIVVSVIAWRRDKASFAA